MGLNLFTAEDFKDSVIFGCDSADHCADRANAILRERGVEVYGMDVVTIEENGLREEFKSWCDKPGACGRTDTHRAILVCVEEMPHE